MAMLAERPISFKGRGSFAGEKCMKPSLASPTKNLGVSPKLEYQIEMFHAKQAAQALQDRQALRTIAFANEMKAIRMVQENARRAELEEKEKEKRIARCEMEQAKPPVPWTFITQETVMNNHDKRAPGMFYGFDFPWSEDKIVEFGPEWLTMALRAAQTISEDNEVTEIITGQRKITAGNNGAKCLFEVRYKRNEPGVDTKLFAKLPYPMTKETKTDRISSSVRKQPMDWSEVNTYRLFEANLPFKTPKYYFGDISAESSNFVLILGRIPFAELSGPSKKKLNPFEVEGPYDKCKDHMLKSPAVEYYACIFDSIARLGGKYYAGTFASEEAIKAGSGGILTTMEVTVEASKVLVVDMKQQKNVVQTGYNFLSSTAKTLYPEYVQEEWFEKMYTKALMQLNAYAAELNFWKEGPGCKYRGIGHMNLNIDNAYFWRDEAGKLDLGVLDWGGFGINNLSHKLWWSLNCSPYDMIHDHGDDLIKGFLKTYKEWGGPDVDFEEFKMGYMITMLQNFMMMVGAIPNSLKMCKAEEFKTITSFSDPRIASDVDGKSTLRTTVNVLYNGVRMIAEMGATKYLDKWVQEVYVGQMGKTAKSDDELLGLVPSGSSPAAPVSQPEEVLPVVGPPELEEEFKAKRIARCEMEQAKPPAPWQFITQETVLSNHDKKAPGMFYGFEFPWSEAKIVEFGPAWLTKALIAAQTMSPDNEVVEIITGQRKITAGNNGAKALFEVRYKFNEPGLDTKLFAKLPYPMTKETKTDRISSSVRKQPMDWCEVNTYRLFEANLPFKTPKYYFGDISAESSNFLLILGRIPFAELSGPSKQKLNSFMVEGPYDKCKDHMLKTPAADYYRCIFDSIARLGGKYYAGTFAPDEAIKGGAMVFEVTEEQGKAMVVPMKQHKTTVQTGYNFLAKTASKLYPDYVQEEWFEKMYTKAMMQLNAYAAEINFWKEGPGCKYRGIGHMNLNIDNAYFWRDEAGNLDLGVLDWGGFGLNNLAHKLWWSLNCSPYEMIHDDSDDLMKGFLKTYKEWGGPDVDLEDFKMSFYITMLQNFLMMVGAIPNSLRMCKAEEFKTITDFSDPRIASDVDGKSTLRTTVNVLYNGVRMIGEMDATKYLDRWVQEVYVGKLGKTEKSDAEVLG